MTEEKKDAPDIIMLPPMLMVLFICAGVIVGWAMPVQLSHGWGWIGLVLVIAAFTLAEWGKRTFQKAGTNVAPNLPATTIVSDGPFQYTRNPMYFAFLMIYAGLAFLTGLPAMLLLIFPLFYILDQKVIVPEEEYLSEKFGEEYLEYKNQVRRWV